MFQKTNAMVSRADMRQYVGPPTVAAIAQMIKGGVQVKTNSTVVTRDILVVKGHDVINHLPLYCRS